MALLAEPLRVIVASSQCEQVVERPLYLEGQELSVGAPLEGPREGRENAAGAVGVGAVADPEALGSGRREAAALDERVFESAGRERVLHRSTVRLVSEQRRLRSHVTGGQVLQGEQVPVPPLSCTAMQTFIHFNCN